MQTELLTWLIPLPPLLAFGLIVLFAHRNNRISHTLAIGAMALSWGLGMIVFWTAVTTEHLAEHPIASSVPWLPTGSTALRIGVFVDPLAAVTLFFVAWTCLAIFVYSVGYHNFGAARDPQDLPGLPPRAGGVDPMYARFFAFLSLFAFGMLTLVVSDILLTLFVGWEIMGLCSYLLIGFWYGKESAKRAMIKAFITTRVGDVFMLLGLAYLYTATGTLSYREILFDHATLERLAGMPSVLGAGLSAAGLIGLLLFIWTVGKSAQLPLHVWLPDAMEGPTPVSAMIHAATMVTAGVYLVVRSHALFEASPVALPMVLVIGLVSALYAALASIGQFDIKRALAYSTMSQIGFMFFAAGMGFYSGAMLLLVCHAFYKALLFLTAGNVLHGMHDESDMRRMGGLRGGMPVSAIWFAIGALSLAGIPPLAGFFAKDHIVGYAASSGREAVRSEEHTSELQ